MQPIKKQCLPALQKIYKEIKKTDKTKLDKNLFDNELDKRADALLAHSLASEQGYVCCYCMNSIDYRTKPDGTIIRGNISEKGERENLKEDEKLPLYHCKVEHFKPRSIYDGSGGKPDLRIKYDNLLCACLGHQEKATHCDTLKGDSEFSHLPNPAEVKAKDFKRLYELKYTSKGVVKSENPEINAEIGGEENKEKSTPEITVYKQGILNLNVSELIALRQKAWNIVWSKITNEMGTQKWEDNPKLLKTIAEKYYKMYNTKAENKYIAFYGCVLYLLKNRFKAFLAHL